ncbi:MAG: hypothetical protein O7B81_14445 [Gammaproteobacteria bacterium]|nr:hypothetical protein [Gammaproteobacteria bacterium]MCZ6894827.1 hypothetical protein [Gammaproteobacteria bacterium]
MPRFEFEQSPDSGDLVDQGTRILNLVVRGFGLVLLLVGMIVALMVITSAWSLYDDPEKIESFARAIEHGSNLDLSLSSAKTTGRRQLDSSSVDGGPILEETVAPRPEFRFSYFIAWLIAILLLMMIGRLSITAVRTGGELALYDVQVKKLARALLEERARIN